MTHKPPVLLDLHVQKDLFFPGGSLYREGVDRTTSNIYRLVRWARRTGTPIISAVLLARQGHHGPFALEPHCVEGSGGEEKLPRTLLPHRINLGLAHTADLPRDVLAEYDQVVFETRDEDVFHHQKFERLITELLGDHSFVLCGATAAAGIKQAVLGLRGRGFEVVVVKNAILDLDDPETEMAWLQTMAKGAQLMSTAQVVREYAVPRRRVVVAKAIAS
jgi:nicotinamidase-related amidase